MEACPSGDGDQMDDRVRRAADRHVGPDRVVESLRRQDVGRLGAAGVRHLDRAPAGQLRHDEATRVGRGNRGEDHVLAGSRRRIAFRLRWAVHIRMHRV